ncbi:hypothetical protein [Bacillus cereus]|uniref:hypothetical protein n=1 Tax=Bacillus cereus TaxID=1396 RepID=UPI001152078F|nr:hypothetical protein [Bacillus cereus]
MRKNFKKIAPIAVLSATMLCSPASSFAAEQTPAATQSQSMEQTQGIKGYLIKDGIQTPVYKNNVTLDQTNDDNIEYPQLSANPNDPVPGEGKIKTESALPSSTLYFADCTYAEKTDDGHIEIGAYNPDTLERTPNNSMAYLLNSDGTPMNSVQKGMIKMMDTKNGTHKYQDLIDAQYKPYWDGTTLVRETSFKNKDVGIVPKTGVYTFSKAVTSGLTTSDAIGGALTLGYKLKVKGGGGILPAEAEHEFSTQLTTSYNHTITVSHQETDTRTLSNQKVADSYPYDKYVGAVYQLSSTYTVNPGPALKKAPVPLAQNQFSYADSVLYLTVTPGVTG